MTESETQAKIAAVFESIVNDFAAGKPIKHIRKKLAESGIAPETILNSNIFEHQAQLDKLFKLRGGKFPRQGYTAKLIRSKQDFISLKDFFKANLDDDIKMISPLVDLLYERDRKHKLMAKVLFGLVIATHLEALMQLAPHLSHTILGPLIAVYDKIKDGCIYLGKLGALGMGLNLILSCYAIYKTLNDPSLSTLDKSIETAFQVTSGILGQISYGVIMAAGGSMTPVAAVISLASSLVELFRSLYSYLRAYQAFSELAKPAKDAPLQEHINYAQKRLFLAGKARTALVGLASAAVMAGIVAIWVFSPPSIILTVVCVLAMLATTLVQTIVNDKIQKGINSQVQKSTRSLLKKASPEERAALTESQVGEIESLMQEAEQLDEPLAAQPSTLSIDRATSVRGLRNIMRYADIKSEAGLGAEQSSGDDDELDDTLDLDSGASHSI